MSYSTWLWEKIFNIERMISDGEVSCVKCQEVKNLEVIENEVYVVHCQTCGAYFDINEEMDWE
jgi:transcription elongation factor Elf1